MYNPNGPITALCAYARKNNNLTNCDQRLHTTQLWAVCTPTHIQPLYVPTLRCFAHPPPNVSYIYGWTCDEDKFVPGFGDKIDPLYEIWTLIPFGTQEYNCRGNNFRSLLKCRYHFTDIALEAFTDHFMLASLVKD